MKLNFRSAAVLSAVLVACASGDPRHDSEAPAIANWSALSVGSVDATQAIQSDWKTGYCTDITLKNNGTSSVTSWTVVMNLHHSVITSSYGGKVSGGTFSPESYNGTIAAGGTAKFGFCANATGTDYLATIASLSAVGGGSSGGTGSAGASGVGAGGGGGRGGASNAGGSAGASGRGGSSGSGGSAGASTGGATCPTISGTQGWASRYWDCCKPHCGWSANVSGGAALSSCSATNQSLGSNYNVSSACSGGS